MSVLLKACRSAGDATQMYLVGGGVPIIANGVLVGAVGVAGLPQYEDEAAGRAGIAAWERSRAGAR